MFLEFSHFDLEHSWSIDDEGGKSSSCIFDFLIIEEHDSSDTIVRTDKHCQTMPKALNTSYAVVLKLVDKAYFAILIQNVLKKKTERIRMNL